MKGNIKHKFAAAGKTGRIMKVMFMTFFLVAGIYGPLETVSAEQLNLGMIDDSASKMIKRFTPLMNYLNDNGVPAGKIVTAKTVDKMIEFFNEGKVDFMFESPYAALELMDKTGAVPILIREKSGVKSYNSVIFVKKDSPVKSFSDLVGKVVAFEDPTSTSSYLMPVNLLKNAGVTVKESSKPTPGVISYYFSKDDKNTIAQVKAGKKAAAGGIKKSEVEDNPDFRMLSPESSHVPRHVVLIRKGVSSEKLEAVLLKMINDSGAKDVLKTMKTPTGFSEFDGVPVEVMNTTVRKTLGL